MGSSNDEYAWYAWEDVNKFLSKTKRQ